MERVQLRALLTLALATVVVLDADAFLAEKQFIPAVPGAPSSEGEKFVVAFMRNNIPRTAGSPEPQVFFMVTTLDIESVVVDVMTAFGGVEESDMYTVTRDQPVRVNFSADSVYVVDDNDNDKAIWVQTRNGKKVSVYVINDEEASSDGFVALPCDGMGAGGVFRRYDYLVLSGAQVLPEEQQQQPRNSLILLITCEDDTRVTVTPSQTISGGNDFAENTVGPEGEAAEDDWIIVGPEGISNSIPAKRTLLILNTFDLTGSRVRSTKPLVVIAGHECAHVPEDETACDFIAAQIPPHMTWGRSFVLNPLASRLSGDYYRFATLQDNTDISITCVDAGGTNETATTTTMTLNAAVRQNWGQFETHLPLPPPCPDPFVPKFCSLESTNPVVVAQYSYGHSIDGPCQPEGISGDLGDPFMSVIPPIVQYLNSYVIPPVILRQHVSFRYVSVTVSARFFNPSRILLDGSPLQIIRSSWKPIFDKLLFFIIKIHAYVYNLLVDSNVHIISHMDENAAISVHSYGFSNENSYGLSGGMELQHISGTTISCTIPDGCVNEGVTVTVTCDRGLDRAVQTRIEISSEDDTAIAGVDYNMINFPGIGANRLANNVINYRGGMNMDESHSFTFSTIADSDDTEPPECFYINIIAMRTASVLTPRIKVTICGVIPGCPELDDPPNGEVNWTGLDTGDIATYMCDDGFKLNGQATRTCQDDGTWSGMPPICEPCCPELDDPNNGKVNWTGLSPGDIATYMCDDDFKLNGEATRTCQDDGTWSGMAPTCEPCCPELDNPSNGKVTWTGLAPGDIATYMCDDGFMLNGQANRTCQDDGIWSGMPPMCEPIMCPPLPDIDNGMVDWSGLSPGDIATYTCDHAFILVGDPTRNCGSDGTWSGEEPRCEQIECPELDDPYCGMVEWTSLLPRGVATYTCNHSCELIGDPTRDCTYNGTWSGEEPRCELIECRELDDPYCGMVEWTSLFPGGVATFTCNHSCELIGDPTRDCTYNGTWSGEDPRCELIECRELDDPYCGMVEWTSLFPGGVATYTCNHSCELIGDPTRDCTYNGTWSGEEPRCEQIECPELDDPECGMVEWTSLLPGGFATYTCNHSCQLIGDPTRNCTYDGTWSGEEPRCESIMCRPLPDIDNGMVSWTGLAPGDVAMYTCDDGFILVGDPTRNCTYDGTWSDEEPRCEPLCPALPNPDNGMVTWDSLAPGGVATYTCDPGFIDIFPINGFGSSGSGPSGSGFTLRFRICGSDGTWSGMAPTCERQCPELDAPTNGMVEWDSLAPGGVALYTCVPGFILMGELIRICGSDGTWSGVPSTCEPILCPELPNPTNGMVTWTSLSPGGVATYTCNDGYELVGESMRNCLSDGMWDNFPPICVLVTGSVSFSPITYTVTEGLNPTADLMVVRRGGLGRTITVTVTTVVGSAADGSDFNTISLQITFGPEQLSATVQVPIVNDNIIENTEMFTAILMTAEENVEIIDNTATVTIIDDDDCPPLPAPPNGSVTVIDDKAFYACNDGFMLVGDPMRMCMNDSTWSGTAPMCIAIMCPELPAIENGMVSWSGLSPGGVATYTCDDGFILVGDPTRICRDDGTWSGEEPTCEPPRPQFVQTMYTVPENDRTVPLCIDAGVDIPESKNFTVTAVQKSPPEADDADFNHWTVVHWNNVGPIACTDFSDLVVDDDIALEGDQNFTILVDGSMAMVTIIDDDFPRIESDNIVINEAAGSARVTVRLLNEIENDFVLSYRTAEVDGGANDEEDFESQGGTITFVPGGAKSLPVDIPITDDTNPEPNEPFMVIFSSMDLPPGMQDVLAPNVTIIDNEITMCPELPDIDNGNVTWTGLAPGDVATYTCDSGFILVGDPTRNCTNNGTWSGEEPTCEPIMCPPLPDIDNGVVEWSGLSPGGVATYTCDPGFILVGDVTRRCRDNGTWSGEEPTCDPIMCPPLPDIDNGVVEWSGLSPGGVATYTCDPGFILVGDVTRRCRDNGTWSGEEPTCDPIMCPPLPDIDNGVVEWSGLSPGGVATYTCDPGFILVGDATRICRDNGTWSGEEPTCDPILCPALSNPDNGMVTWDSLAPGGIATYTCDPGFSLVGDPTRICGSDDSWSGMAPTCELPELTTLDVTVSEDVGEASVCVRLANTFDGPFGVRFDTSDGTAQAPDDYIPISAAFGFIPDETCVDIRINDDNLQEPTENFFVTFVPEVPGARPVIATVNIRDNDGDIVNDTIIGDPLFTATLPDGDEFMCYEVHGQAGKYFNLISDTCLSVNAFFSALPEEPRINRISEIGIYARDSADTCVPIEIDLEGCTGSIGGQPFIVGPSGRVRYDQSGISVRSYPARWRVSVPNCGSTPVVMWIFCGSDPAMMRIHIARGNGLAQSSHGLLAQFWNIPVTILREGDQVTLQLFDPLDPRYRLIPAVPAPRTWDHTRATCYYVGNAQGGPAHSHDAVESVIEGNLLQYETSTLFSPEFDFNQFDDSFCITPA